MAVEYKLGKNFLRTSILVLCGILISASPNFASADTTASLLPSSDGTYTSWTPSTGSTHYTLVDETTCNGTTDYNSVTTVGNRDSYGISLSSVPDGSTITSISITPCASRNSSGGGSSTMNVFYRFDGTNSADAGAYALSGTTPSSLAATNFSSLSLVKGSASTLQIGAVYSAGTKGARLSRMATVLTYTPLTAPSALSGSAASQTQINLSWTDNSSTESGFKVERSSTSSTGPFTQIATTSANATSFNDTGLTAGTTYWYRVQAYNAGGNSAYTGVVVATTLAAAPTVTTNSASSVTASSATLNGSANPNGASATGWFRYSTTNPGTCDDTFGTRAPASGGTNLGGGTGSVAYSNGIISLSADTTYYFCAISSNSGGTSFGSVQSLTTLPNAPTAPSGLGTSVVSQTAVDLSWTDNSSNESGFKVERSSTGSGGTYVHVATTSANATSFNDTGLTAGTTYWYKVRAFNNGGNSSYTTAVSATTFANAPTVTTNSASSVTASSATLNGSANPNGASATGWFRYSTTNPGTCDDTFGTRAPASGGTNLGFGTSNVAYSNGISSLSEGTTYYFCAISSNNGGNGYGSVGSFTTSVSVPSAPSSLGTSTVSGTEIDLSWTDNSSNESGFKVERSSTGSTGGFSHIATTSANATTFSDTGLTADQTYWYKVRAYNAGGNSSYTSVVYAITATVVPSDPSGLSVTASSTSAVIDWTDNSSNEENFRVEKSTDGVNFSEIATKTLNTTQHVDPSLTTGTYYYRVKATNSIGNSGYTSTESIVIP